MGKRRRRTYLQAGGGAEGCQREGGMGEERGFLGWEGRVEVQDGEGWRGVVQRGRGRMGEKDRGRGG